MARGRREVPGRPSLWATAPRPSLQSLDDLLVYCALGAVIGGRLGNALFYDPGYYLAHPLEIFMVWRGGMAYHGGMLGVLVGVMLFARRYRVPWVTVLDLACLAGKCATNKLHCTVGQTKRARASVVVLV